MSIISTVTSSIASLLSPAAPATASPAPSLADAVSGVVKTDVVRALGAAGLGSFATSQPVADAIGKISQDAVSALQSPGAKGAAAAVSSVITGDVGSVLNQFGMGAYASSGDVADFEKGLAADVMSAAASAGYGQATATVQSPAATPAAAAAAPAATAASPATAVSQAAAAVAVQVATSTASPSASSTAALGTVQSIVAALSPIASNDAGKATAIMSSIADALWKASSGSNAAGLITIAQQLRETSAGSSKTAAAAAAAGPAASATTAASTTSGTAAAASSTAPAVSGASAKAAATAAGPAQLPPSTASAASAAAGSPDAAALDRMRAIVAQGRAATGFSTATPSSISLGASAGTTAADMLQEGEKHLNSIMSGLSSSKAPAWQPAAPITVPQAASVTVARTGTNDNAISSQHPVLRAYAESAAA